MNFQRSAMFGGFLGGGGAGVKGLRSVAPHGGFLLAHESDVGGGSEEGGGAGGGAATRGGGGGGIVGAAALDVFGVVEGLLHGRGRLVTRKAVGSCGETSVGIRGLWRGRSGGWLRKDRGGDCSGTRVRCRGANSLLWLL